MAIVITEPKRGRLGPSVYLQSRYGVMQRQRVIPLNPRSSAQRTQRSIMSAVPGGWRGLSDAQRATWTERARQVPGQLDGAQLYTKVNTVLVSCGMPTVAVAPRLPALGILSCTGLTVDDTPLVKLTQVSNTVVPDKFIVEATPPVEPGVQNLNTRFRRLTVVAGHGDPAADLDLTAAYTARFGAPLVGQRVVVRIVAMKDGFKGYAQEFGTLVAAHGA